MKDKLKDKMKKKFTDLSISHKMLMVYITFASAFLLIALGLTQISFRIYSKELYDKSLRGRVCQDTFCGFSKLNDLSVKKPPKTSCLQMS